MQRTGYGYLNCSLTLGRVKKNIMSKLTTNNNPPEEPKPICGKEITENNIITIINMLNNIIAFLAHFLRSIMFIAQIK